MLQILDPFIWKWHWNSQSSFATGINRSRFNSDCQSRSLVSDWRSWQLLAPRTVEPICSYSISCIDMRNIQVLIDITIQLLLQIAFDAITGRNHLRDIAIDDLSFSLCSCPGRNLLNYSKIEMIKVIVYRCTTSGSASSRGLQL